VHKAFTLIHRYVGLTMTIFLVIVGLTGSTVAFYRELDGWLNPQLLTVQERGQSPLDVLALREQVERSDPRIRIDYPSLHREPGESLDFTVQARADSKTQRAYDLGFTDIYLNPYTGAIIGKRDWGRASLDKEHLLPFLYRLHYSLALPKWLDDTTRGFSIGGYLLGVVALLWTFDCFIGLYLTLPRWRREPGAPARRSWWRRWQPAWLIKYSRFNYDLHRACGLWVWAMLFVFAWSSVAFNLNEVYSPAMHAAFRFRGELPPLATPLESPRLSFVAARAAARELMSRMARKRGFEIQREEQLSLDRTHGVYFYAVRSSADSGRWGTTSLSIDANTGVLRAEQWPGNERAGDTIGRWITLLHMAAVFGLPMQILVGATGVTVVVLSVTGAVIWWRKSGSRSRGRAALGRPRLDP